MHAGGPELPKEIQKRSLIAARKNGYALETKKEDKDFKTALKKGGGLKSKCLKWRDGEGKTDLRKKHAKRKSTKYIVCHGGGKKGS